MCLKLLKVLFTFSFEAPGLLKNYPTSAWVSVQLH